MRELGLIILFLITSMSIGCKKEDPITTILKRITKDGIIDEAEMKQLKARSAYKVLWTNNEVDTTKIKTYLKNAKLPNVKFDYSIMNTEKPICNVFLENSASMDGYVKGKTKFESSIYKFLSDININSNITDTLNLNYINSKTIPFSPKVEDFIDKLEPSTFSSRGGDRGNSDMKNILENILKETTDNTVSIFISDCLFSLKKSNNTEQYLTNQQIGIKTIFANKLKEMDDLAVLVLHLNSDFNGSFYTYHNQIIRGMKQERPFYIWIMGKHDNIKNLLQEIDINNSLDNNLENYFCWSVSNESPMYRTTMRDLIGSYKPNPDNTLYGIQNPKRGTRAEQKGIFQFSIAVDLDGFGLDPNYINNPKNYQLSENEFEVVKTYEISENDQREVDYLKDYSHIIVLQTKKIKKTDLDISLKQIFPNWVNDWHWEPENGKDEKAELKKSFGLKYLLEGVDDAYKGTKAKEKNFFTLTINIEN